MQDKKDDHLGQFSESLGGEEECRLKREWRRKVKQRGGGRVKSHLPPIIQINYLRRVS